MADLVQRYRLDPNTDKGRAALADEWLAKSIKKDSLPAQVWQKIVSAENNLPMTFALQEILKVCPVTRYRRHPEAPESTFPP